MDHRTEAVLALRDGDALSILATGYWKKCNI